VAVLDLDVVVGPPALDEVACSVVVVWRLVVGVGSSVAGVVCSVGPGVAAVVSSVGDVVDAVVFADVVSDDLASLPQAAKPIVRAMVAAMPAVRAREP